MKTRLDFDLAPKQFVQAVRHNSQRLMRTLPTHKLMQLLSISALAVPVLLLAYAASLMRGQYAATLQPVAIAALVLLSVLILYSALYYLGFNQLLRRSTQFVGSRTSISIEDHGLRTSSIRGESFIPWSALLGVDEIEDVILLLLDNIHFIPVSMSAFDSPEEKDAFVATVRNHISRAATVSRTDTMPAAPTSTAHWVTATPIAASAFAVSLKSSIRTFVTSLGQAFKLLVFLPVAEERIAVLWWQIPIFALLNLLIGLIWSLFKIGLAGQFLWFSLPPSLFHLPVLLLAAIFVAYTLRRTDKTQLLIQVFLMIALAFDLAMSLIGSVFTLQPTLFSRPFLGFPFFSLQSFWLALACFVAAKRYTLPKLSQRISVMAITLIFIALPLGVIYRQYSLWQIPYDEAAANPKYGLSNEDIFYNQQKLLGHELRALQAERAGVTDVFLIGMAGYAEQDVFMKEVDAVARLFRERFDADGHIIRLVNNHKTLASSPIASATSLKAALNRVAQVMNKEEDILFLFLTSHGSAAHHFSLDLWPLNFNQLDPIVLRKLLDDSGIQNRVVVVSACYSGGFTQALKDAHTLVITASAPDKNSFGCSNENDWTYFGEAYFNQALRKTHSFVEAFHLATPLVTSREKKEKFEPSNPQMALGTAIQNKLAILEQQLEAPQPTAIKLLNTPDPKSLDPFERYVALSYDPKYAAQGYEACVTNMHAYGPETLVERNPNYFSGLNKTSALWPRLANAWNQYAESYCAKVNDPDLMRALYVKHLRANISTQDLEPVLKFLNSESGRHWFPSERKAMLRLSTELSKIQIEIEAPLAKAYQDEQMRIYNDFNAEKQPQNGKTAK